MMFTRDCNVSDPVEDSTQSQYEKLGIDTRTSQVAHPAYLVVLLLVMAVFECLVELAREDGFCPLTVLV